MVFGLPVLQRWLQTISYLPHFLSWIVIVGILITLLSSNTGVVDCLNFLDVGFRFCFLFSQETDSIFRFTLVTSAIWKEIELENISISHFRGSLVDSQLYEAFPVSDGATPLEAKPCIFRFHPFFLSYPFCFDSACRKRSLDAGFDQILTLYSPAVYGVAHVLDTYVYRVGLQNFQFSLTTAVGLFKERLCTCTGSGHQLYREKDGTRRNYVKMG